MNRQSAPDKKLAVLFNTFVKLKTYDFKALESDFDFIAIVSEEEISPVKKEFGSTFKDVTIFEEAEGVLAKVIPNYKDVKFICISEDTLLFTAKLRENFGLEGMSYKTALLFRDKVEMKKALQEVGVKVPKFKDLKGDETFEELKEELGLPFVIKPKDAFGSKSVSIVGNKEDFENSELIEGFECESFIKGKLYHIDNIWQNGKPIFEVCNEYSCPNEEFRKGKALLSVPLLPDHEISKKASILAKKVVDTFGLKTGATHLEFFVLANGELVFLEVAGRTPGAVIVPMYNKQFGFNLPNIDLLNHFRMLSSEVFERKMHAFSGIIPKIEGVVKALNKPEIASESSFEFLIKEGEYLKQAESLRDIAGKILAFNENFEEAYKDFKTVSNFVIA